MLAPSRTGEQGVPSITHAQAARPTCLSPSSQHSSQAGWAQSGGLEPATEG